MSSNTGFPTAFMGPNINSTGALSAESAYAAIGSTFQSWPTAPLVKTLANGGNNTVTMQYMTTANTTSFYQRWLFALRCANV